MQLPVILLATIETALNTWLKLDGEVLPRFASMQDKVIRLHITGLEINLYFLPAADGIQVLSEYGGEADTTIHGSAMTLVRLGQSNDAGKTMLDTEARIEGDTALGMRFSEILKSVDIDWEEFLSKVVGDMIAHQAGTVMRQTGGWINSTAQAMQMNISEYLSEESQVVVAEAELTGYLDQIDELRMDADRLQARVQRMQKQLSDNE